jgi:hypothetical protein
MALPTHLPPGEDICILALVGKLVKLLMRLEPRKSDRWHEVILGCQNRNFDRN